MKLRAGGVKKNKHSSVSIRGHATRGAESGYVSLLGLPAGLLALCVRSVHSRPVSPLHICAHFESRSHDTQRRRYPDSDEDQILLFSEKLKAGNRNRIS